jgi:hypothetical protein
MIGEKPMQEDTMTTRRTILNLMGTGAASTLALALIASPAAAQTATSQTATAQGGVIAPTTGTKKPTTTTSRMIDEAIQRSQARAAKAAATGTTETFGSEEPFTYVPGKTAN